MLLAFIVICLAFFLPRFLLWYDHSHRNARRDIAERCFRMLVLVLLAAFIMYSVGCGVYVPGTIAIADWCENPQGTIVTLVRENVDPTQILAGLRHHRPHNAGDARRELAGVLRYYLACHGDDPFGAELTGASAMLRNATGLLDRYQNYTVYAPAAQVRTRDLFCPLGALAHADTTGIRTRALCCGRRCRIA